MKTQGENTYFILTAYQIEMIAT